MNNKISVARGELLSREIVSFLDKLYQLDVGKNCEISIKQTGQSLDCKGYYSVIIIVRDETIESKLRESFKTGLLHYWNSNKKFLLIEEKQN